MTPHQEDNKKTDKGPEQTFLQGGHTRAQRQMKGWSTSLPTREMQIKTTMRYCFPPVRMTIITKSTNKCLGGCGEKGTLVHC